MQMTGLTTSKTQTKYEIKCINKAISVAISVNLQQRPLKLSTLIFIIATHSFPDPASLISIF